MASFGLAHILYITAFGLKPLKIKLGCIIYSIAALMIYFYFNMIKDPVLKYGVSIYTILIFTMIWRSLARFGGKGNNQYYCALGKNSIQNIK